MLPFIREVKNYMYTMGNSVWREEGEGVGDEEGGGGGSSTHTHKSAWYIKVKKCHCLITRHLFLIKLYSIVFTAFRKIRSTLIRMALNILLTESFSMP